VCNKPVLDLVKQNVYSAAVQVLGDKLEKIYLYGSYARGDYDEDSDIDIFILADIPQEEAGKTRNKINDLRGYFDLEHDVIVSVHVTGSEIFNGYRSILPFYMNVLKDGVEINA